jgi:hypothetical protein
MLALSLSALMLLSLTSSRASANCSPHPADIAPGVLGSEMPVPSWTVIGNGSIDVQDVLALLNAAVGNTIPVWTPPVEPGCVPLPGNIAPGTQDEGFSPPRWTPTPDGVVDVVDVLVGLRMAVALVVLDPEWLEPVVSDAGVGDRVVAGSVIDSISSLGLPEVLVTALQADTPVGQTGTDAEGKFLLQGLPSGTLKLLLDGSGSTAGGKFSTLEVEIEVDTQATTSVQPITLADETDPDGASGKFTGDESGTVDEEIDLSSGDGNVGLATGPGGKIEVDGEPADGEVDLSVVPIEGEDLPEEVTNPDTGDGVSSTGEAAVGPADGKFTGGGSGLTLGADGPPGFDLTLPNRSGLPIGTMVDIYHWAGGEWVNCTALSGRGGVVVDIGSGMTAVFAAGVATQGGLYAAVRPIDLNCTSELLGRVIDEAGMPLEGVFIRTSVGTTGFTDEFGMFYLPNVPAYTGLDGNDCQARGYEVYVRGGLELGGIWTSVTVEDFQTGPGTQVDLGDIELSVPNEGCLSGLVLANGVPLSGPVTITGPDSGVLVADAEGRFFQSGLAPGDYRAAFLFPGEDIAREFDFEIRSRLCTAIRLALTEGSGSQRLTVELIYDEDDDFLTPNGPLPGALVRIVGSDPTSSQGLEGITGPNGRVVFDSVDPPYDIVAVKDMAMPPQLSGGRPLVEGDPEPFMRIGAGIMSPAPLGHVSLLLGLPLTIDEPDTYEEASVQGVISNLPMLPAGKQYFAAPLRRGLAESPYGGFVDGETGDYFTGGSFGDFDIAVGLQSLTWPNRIMEINLFGPFRVLPPATMYDAALLEQDLDYGSSAPIRFDQTLNLTYQGFLTTANYKDIGISGQRPDGRSFWVLDALIGDGAPLPTSTTVPDPASTDLNLALEIWSEGDDILGAQGCFVPLPSPLPATLQVQFNGPPDFRNLPGLSLTLEEAVNGPIEYDTTSLPSTRGFDVLFAETLHEIPRPDGLAASSFRRYLPAAAPFGQGSIGPTPRPFVFEDSDVFYLLDTFRGAGFPASHVELFGPGLEGTLAGIPYQPDPVCIGSRGKGFYVEPELP